MPLIFSALLVCLLSTLSINVQAGKLTVTGSSTLAPLMAEIAKRYEANNPGAKVDVQSGGSGKGITDTRDGSAQIGMVSRDLKADERDLKGFLIAKDGVSMIVHSGNPVNELSKAQIIKIYKGEIKNWQDVGGKNAPITVVSKAEGRSTLEVFMHYTGMKSSEIKAQTIIGENEQGIKLVSGNANAIAYVSIGASEVAVNNGVKIKLLSQDGVPPSTEAVRTGKFPITRSLILITKTEPAGEAKKLIEFASSKKVKDLIERQNFVPPTVK